MSMLPPALIAELARKLYDARKTRTQLRHFSTEHPQMTIEDGYAIQREWVRLELADGHTIRGRKIGLTSRAMQQASQITEPDYAPLMDDMFFESGAELCGRRRAPALPTRVGWHSHPRSSSGDARSRSAAAACGSCARHKACAPVPRSGRVAACSWLPEERMDGAVLGIEHLLTLIDLEGQPDIALGEQRLEVCFGSGQQGLAGALLDGRGASAAHAQIEIHE